MEYAVCTCNVPLKQNSEEIVWLEVQLWQNNIVTMQMDILNQSTERFTDLGKLNFPMVVWF